MYKEFDVNSIEAAVDQLDWAIRLLLDYQAYVPAITLAGAAEEILGKKLPEEQSALNQLRKSLSQKLSISKDDIDLNLVRNFLKHGKNGESDTALIPLEGWAMTMITRAMVNLMMLDRSLPSEGLRFHEKYHNR